MRLRISIRGHVRPSVGPSVRPSVRRSVGPSVGPVLFSNDEKRHVPCSDVDEILHGPRESRGQFKNDIKMSVRRSVLPSDVIFKKKVK